MDFDRDSCIEQADIRIDVPDPKSAEMIKAAWLEVLRRIPIGALAFVTFGGRRPLPILETVNDATSWMSAWIVEDGANDDESVHIVLNVANNDQKDLVFVLAHEFAHVYVSCLAGNASLWLSQMAGGEELSNLCLAPLTLGAVKAEERISENERLADAVALAWGFDVELAAHLKRLSGPPRPEYLDASIAAIVRELK